MPEHAQSRVRKSFQCTHIMGVSAPTLLRESTDSSMQLGGNYRDDFNVCDLSVKWAMHEAIFQ